MQMLFLIVSFVVSQIVMIIIEVAKTKSAIDVCHDLGLGGGILGLVYCAGKSGLCLIGELVLVVEFADLGDGLFYKVSYNSKSSYSRSNKIVLVIDLIDFSFGGSQSTFNFGDGSGVNCFLGLKLIQSTFKRFLGGSKNFVLVVESGQVVVNFKGRLGDSSDNLSGFVLTLRDVVSSGSSNDTTDRSSDNESGNTPDKTGSEFNRFLLDGNKLASGSAGSSDIEVTTEGRRAALVTGANADAPLRLANAKAE